MLALAKRKLCYSTNWIIERLLDAPEISNLLGIHILLDVWFAVVDAASHVRAISGTSDWARLIRYSGMASLP